MSQEKAVLEETFSISEEEINDMKNKVKENLNEEGEDNSVNDFLAGEEVANNPNNINFFEGILESNNDKVDNIEEKTDTHNEELTKTSEKENTEEVLEENVSEKDNIPVQENEETQVENNNPPKTNNVEEQTNEKPAPNMKIKEVKYGMTVITNIGNFENIRTHIEATAEIESNEDFIDSIEALSHQIRNLGRKEYQQIKRTNGDWHSRRRGSQPYNRQNQYR